MTAMAEYVAKEQIIEWFRPYGHMDEPIPFETLISDLRDCIPAADVTHVNHCRSCDYRRHPDGHPEILYCRWTRAKTPPDGFCHRWEAPPHV